MTLLQAARARQEVALVESVDMPAAHRLRLAELGIRPGASLRVVKRAVGGGLVVAIGTSRIALDRATSQRIGVAAPAGAS